jgi:hypothetical protein
MALAYSRGNHPTSNDVMLEEPHHRTAAVSDDSLAATIFVLCSGAFHGNVGIRKALRRCREMMLFIGT